MHSYLRAIGFTDTFSCEKELEQLLEGIVATAVDRKRVRDNHTDRVFLEMSQFYGPHIGIRVCGEMDSDGFHRQYYFPFMTGSGVTSEEAVSIEPKLSGNGYAGMVDDSRVGVSVIFQVLNCADCRKVADEDGAFPEGVTTTLSALSTSGMILLPMKSEEGPEKGYRDSYNKKHDSLVLAAKEGNQEAIESLTMEDMDTYAMITRRLIHEDVFTIVDTFFMPYGLECDLYQIMGEIRFYTKVQNTMTKEVLYQLTVECNGMLFDVCINEKDLLGAPEEGRRFKGNIWLQGQVNIFR